MQQAETLAQLLKRLLRRALWFTAPTNPAAPAGKIAVSLKPLPAGPGFAATDTAGAGQSATQQVAWCLVVADTGAAIPDSDQVLSNLFHALLSCGAPLLADGWLNLRTTGLDESHIRSYRLRLPAGADSNPAGGRGGGAGTCPLLSIVRQASGAKSCGGSNFSGSEATLQLHHALAPDMVANVLHAVLQLSSLAAPRCELEARLHPPPQPPHTWRPVGADGRQQAAPGPPCAATSQQASAAGVVGAEFGGAVERLRYDHEPLPADMAPEQRLLHGVSTVFEALAGDDESDGAPACAPQLPHAPGADASMEDVDASHPAGAAAPQRAGTYVLGAAGACADDPGQPPVLARGRWSAHVVLVVGPGPEAAEDSGGAADAAALAHVVPVYVFRNACPAACAQSTVGKALLKVCWSSFGLEAALQEALPDGTCLLHLKPSALSRRLAGLVVSLTSTGDLRSECTNGRPTPLSPVSEGRLVRWATESALCALKSSCPGSMRSRQEERLSLALPYLAKAVAGLVAQGGPELHAATQTLALYGGYAEEGGGLESTVRAALERGVLAELCQGEP